MKKLILVLCIATAGCYPQEKPSSNHIRDITSAFDIVCLDSRKYWLHKHTMLPKLDYAQNQETCSVH